MLLGSNVLERLEVMLLYRFIELCGTGSRPEWLKTITTKEGDSSRMAYTYAPGRSRSLCYLILFLQRFIPRRAELVRIMKYGKESSTGKEATERQQRRKVFSEEFLWDSDKNTAFQAWKQAIANNAIAAPDPNAQYHLAVDVGRMGL